MFKDRNAALYAAALAGLTVLSMVHLAQTSRADDGSAPDFVGLTASDGWAVPLARAAGDHNRPIQANQRRRDQSGWLFRRRRGPTTGADIVFGRRDQAAPRSGRPAKQARTRRMDRKFLPTVVKYGQSYDPGTIVIDTRGRFLYLVLDNGKARRYGVGVGRTGFGWTGTVNVGRKAEWPGWTPPPEMRKREPWLPEYMEGGVNNPLGARALYLYRGGQDTIYRIHGSNQPWTIGQAVSSGCFRMRNEDVTDLYERVPVGAKVVVL